MADLTVLVPTRGRIKNSLRLLEAFRATCTADTELVFVISSDDPDHDLYYWHLTKAGGKAVTVDVDKRGVVAPLNAGYEAVKGSLGLAVGFMGDDHCPRTQGWDSALLEDLRALKCGIAYPNDLIQGAEMATAVVMTSDIPKTIGYMAPPELDHFYLDVVWLDWGRGVDKLVYRDDVIVEHLHPIVRKAQMDATYRVSRVLHADDSAKYEAYRDGRLSDDLKALTKLFVEPAPKKAPAKRAPAKKAAPKKAA